MCSGFLRVLLWRTILCTATPMALGVDWKWGPVGPQEIELQRVGECWRRISFLPALQISNIFCSWAGRGTADGVLFLSLTLYLQTLNTSRQSGLSALYIMQPVWFNQKIWWGGKLFLPLTFSLWICTYWYFSASLKSSSDEATERWSCNSLSASFEN